MNETTLSAISLFSGVGMLDEGLRAMTPIPGFEGRYSATEDGRIYSHVSNKFLKPGLSGPYANVALGAGNTRKVHELILLTFCGPRPDGHVGRHGNGNSQDNQLSNLSWSTQSENIMDKVLHGTMLSGERHPMRKLTLEEVSQLRMLRAEGLSYPKLGAKFNISKSQAHRIVSNKNWKEQPCG